MPKLIVEFQNGTREIELSGPRTTLGRSKKCGIFIPDGNLSREHCCFLLEADGTCRVEDLKSLNGTQLNGRRIEGPEPLKPGDLVRVGSVTAHFEERRAAAAPPERRKPVPARAAGTSAVRGRPLKDFSVWVGAGGAGKAVAAGLIVLAAVAAAGGGFLLLRARRAGPEEDPTNLLRSNPSFEAAELTGWTPVGEAPLQLSVESAGASHGARCLSVDKTQATPFVATVANVADQITLPSAGTGLDCSALVRFETFAGSVALQVAWFRRRSETPVLTAVSAPVSGAAAWTPLRARFPAPPGCREARLALVAAGGAGRFLLDHARAESVPGAALPMQPVGEGYAVGHAPSGALLVERAGRLILADVQWTAVARARGEAPPLPAAAASAQEEAGDWKIACERLLPDAEPPVAWESRARGQDGALMLATRWDARARDELDGLLLSLTLADAEPADPPASGVLQRIEFLHAGERFVLEFPVALETTLTPVEGGLRVVARWNGPAAPAASLRLVPAALDRAAELGRLEREAAQARKDGRLGTLAGALGRLKDEVKDPRRAEEFHKELAAIKAREQDAYQEFRRAHAEAVLSGDPKLRTLMLEAMSRYRRVYESEFFADRLAEIAEAVERVSDEPAAGAETAATRLMRRARRYREWGMAWLAEATLRALAERYPETAEAEEARALLSEP
jgi:pSer/pThr/pTyr-binding forkhead associated (FHA) protein